MTEKKKNATSAVEQPQINAWLTDMDGVLVRENDAIPGAQKFIDALEKNEMPYLVLTNNSSSPTAISPLVSRRRD